MGLAILARSAFKATTQAGVVRAGVIGAVCLAIQSAIDFFFAGVGSATSGD